MDKICNVLVAQTSMEEKQMDYIRNEAAKGDVEIRDMKKALSVREVHKCLKETENGEPKYTVLIIQQRLDQSKELVPAEELMKMRRAVPGLRILLCTSRDMAGSKYLQQVFEAGVYTAFYEEDGTMKNIVDLIRNGRSAKNAIAYYQIPEDNPETRKQIGYIEKERLKKLLTLIHNAKDSEIDDVLKHIRTMLKKKEILYLISNMGEDDVERVFFRKNMGLFFNQEKYMHDRKENESGGLLKRFKKTELSFKEYLLEPDELDARIELVNIKRQAKERKQKEKEQSELAKQVEQIETEIKQEEIEKKEEDVEKPSEPISEERKGEVSPQSAETSADKEDAVEDTKEDPSETHTEEIFQKEDAGTAKDNVAANNAPVTVGEEQIAALQTLLGNNMDPAVLTVLLGLSNNSNPEALASLVGALQKNTPQQEQSPANAEDVSVTSEPDINENEENNLDEIPVENEKQEDTTSVEFDLDTISENTSEVEEQVSQITEKEQEMAVEKEIPVKELPASEENISEEPEIEIELEENVEDDKEDETKLKEKLAEVAKTPLVFSSLTIKDENVKKGNLYYVISAGKHSGATTMSSVLAYTYKHKYKAKKVCVCSYDGNIDDYANLIDEELGADALDREKGRLTYKDVDFFVTKRSEILGLQREYDAVFVDMKGIGQFNKNFKKEKVFLVTQGSTPQIKGLHKTLEQVKEIGFSDVSIIATLKELNEEQEKGIRKSLDCPLYNIGFLHSATKYSNELRNSFVKRKK